LLSVASNENFESMGKEIETKLMEIIEKTK